MDEVLTSRDRLLEVLIEQPHTKPELVDALSISRSTVDRGITALLESGCADQQESVYRATEKGRLAMEARNRYLEDLEHLEAADPILETVSLESVSMRFLRHATVDLPDPQAPWTALEPSMQLVYEARSLDGTAPAVFDQFFDDIADSIDNGGLSTELVLDAALFEAMSDTEQVRLREIIEAGGGRLFTTELSDSYAIWITENDDRVVAGITVYSETGLTGVAHADDPDAVAWARAEYAKRRDDATLVWDYS
ncbi:helix-turn-helix transcriptional regulator [Natrialbaceae archaeon A-CW3]